MIRWLSLEYWRHRRRLRLLEYREQRLQKEWLHIRLNKKHPDEFVRNKESIAAVLRYLDACDEAQKERTLYEKSRAVDGQ